MVVHSILGSSNWNNHIRYLLSGTQGVILYGNHFVAYNCIRNFHKSKKQKHLVYFSSPPTTPLGEASKLGPDRRVNVFWF